MRRLVVAALALSACGEVIPGEAACSQICELALHCGFLPSSLGGRAGDDMTELYDDCHRRCSNTDDDDLVAKLRGCFGPPAEDLCDPSQCLAAAECVQGDAGLPNAVLGDADIVLRALDGVFWSAVFRPTLCEDASEMTQSDYGLDNYCASTADPGAAEGAYACAERPDQPALCGPDDCEAHVGCDPSMCGRPFITAEADCRYYGITSVQFGYRDASGALQLSPNQLTCAEASAGEPFHGVQYGSIVPVALYRGKFTAATAVDLHLDPEKVVGQPFCWASWPLEPRRLTRSGETVMIVPTPSTAQLIDSVYERDRDFPVGCGCIFETIDCEETFEDCHNGIDDDEDGLVDALDFGCRPPAEQECKNGVDDDGDGAVDNQDPPCEPCNGRDDDLDGREDGKEPECVQCGDGILGPAEECDDGNLDATDGCDADCMFECGDGVLGPGEACDDGNRAPGDGCDASCMLEESSSSGSSG